MTASRSATVLAALICVSSIGVSFGARAADRVLTYEEALALARERAPAVVSARARVDEASGRVRDASVLLRNNPVVEAEAGNRVTPGEEDSVDLRFGLTQTFALGGGRGARIAGARADRARAVASAEGAVPEVLRDVAVAFYRALYAKGRLLQAAKAESLAVDLVRISERRYQAGDIARLDVNVARTAQSRARAEVLGAETFRSTALGDLRRLLGMDPEESLAVRGDLDARGDLDLAELLERASDRPDLRTLAAEIERADADARLGGSKRWPEITLGVGWEREESSEIGLGLVALTLPIFDHGQGARDESRARRHRLRGEYEALRRSVAIEVETAYSIHRATLAAVEELEENALPLLDENEALAHRGYASGQLGLSELLLLRHEFIGTRLEYLARLLDAAVARAELQASAGVLQ